MNKGLKIIEIAAALFITVIVISIGFYLLNSGEDASKVVNNKISSANIKISESGKTKYENTELSGADVINAIRGNADNIIVSVQTITTADGSVTSNDYSIEQPYSATPSDKNYINPNAKFIGSLERNSNDVITKLVFTQKEYVNNAVAWNGSSSGSSGNGGSGTGGASDEDVVTTLNGIATSLTSTISSLNTGLSAISSSIQTISYNTDPNNQPQTTVKVDMTQVTAKLSDVAEALTDLQDTMTVGIRGDSGDVEGPNMSDLSLSIAQLQEAVDKLSTTGGSGSSSGDASDVDVTLDELQTSIADLTTAVAGVSSNLQELSDFVMGDPEDASGSKDSMSAQLADASNSISDLKKILEGLEDKIDTINANLEGTTK